LLLLFLLLLLLNRQVVQKLVSAIAKRIRDNFNSPMERQPAGNAFYGLQSMSAEPAAVQAVQAKLGVQAAGALVEHTLAEVACALVAQGVRQLVVAGGETSGAVVAALQVREMAIGAQIDPGVPWTAAASPHCGAQPLHLALKSGNFGAADFFTRAFARLRPA
jgi:uncharacterized protein YgbK (DUF1537 family)